MFGVEYNDNNYEWWVNEGWRDNDFAYFENEENYKKILEDLKYVMFNMITTGLKSMDF